jgi:hypothetical protein
MIDSSLRFKELFDIASSMVAWSDTRMQTLQCNILIK